MTPDQLNNFLVDYGPIVWVIVVTMIIIIVIGKAWPFISGVVKMVNIIQEMPEKLKSIEERIKKVEEEVTTNSGSSLKDAVKRIEARTCGNCDTQ